MAHNFPLKPTEFQPDVAMSFSEKLVEIDNCNWYNEHPIHFTSKCGCEMKYHHHIIAEILKLLWGLKYMRYTPTLFLWT